MKTLLIETVANGWIVRPFQPFQSWATSESPFMYVFTKIEDLQAAIPEILNKDEFKCVNMGGQQSPEIKYETIRS